MKQVECIPESTRGSRRQGERKKLRAEIREFLAAGYKCGELETLAYVDKTVDVKDGKVLRENGRARVKDAALQELSVWNRENGTNIELKVY